jgi:hypothetical protein
MTHSSRESSSVDQTMPKNTFTTIAVPMYVFLAMKLLIDEFFECERGYDDQIKHLREEGRDFAVAELEDAFAFFTEWDERTFDEQCQIAREGTEMCARLERKSK